MASHTPGPWRTVAPDEHATKWMVSRKPHCGGVPPHKFYVAILEPLDVPGQDVADARLIAAAPDLLKAAKEAEKTIGDLAYLLWHDRAPTDPQNSKRMNQLHAAIVKAEGTS